MTSTEANLGISRQHRHPAKVKSCRRGGAEIYLSAKSGAWASAISASGLAVPAGADGPRHCLGTDEISSAGGDALK